MNQIQLLLCFVLTELGVRSVGGQEGGLKEALVTSERAFPN